MIVREMQKPSNKPWSRLTPIAPHAGQRLGQTGQSTVEYALVLMGAAALAMLLISWATGTDVIGRLFEAVFGGIIDGAR